ncbi:MAG: hypothetical protein N2249_07990 [Melioribacter sp.]|nr:hypothetical protein [Melioribacter sp.]
MVEIRITIEAAVSILIEKMKIELKERQKCGLIPAGLRLEDVHLKDLQKILEASVFDTLFLLPIDLVVQNSNISYVLTEAIKSLARIFKKEEFYLINLNHIKKIIKQVSRFLENKTKNNYFKNN